MQVQDFRCGGVGVWPLFKSGQKTKRVKWGMFEVIVHYEMIARVAGRAKKNMVGLRLVRVKYLDNELDWV